MLSMMTQEVNFSQQQQPVCSKATILNLRRVKLCSHALTENIKIPNELTHSYVNMRLVLTALFKRRNNIDKSLSSCA